MFFVALPPDVAPSHFFPPLPHSSGSPAAGSSSKLPISPELRALFASFQKCLELRDKYMRLSLQRLGDNPQHIDRESSASPLPAAECDVAGLRADSVLRSAHLESSENEQSGGSEQGRPWGIYPSPPPPHWHPSHANTLTLNNTDASSLPVSKTEELGPATHPDPEGRRHVSGFEEFDFGSCEIPGVVQEGDGAGWEYGIDERGVYQVYATSASGKDAFIPFHLLSLSCSFAFPPSNPESSSRKPVFEIPSIREYFMDLDYVLSVISDGPTKSYAYKRIKYLSGKFAIYMLLNEDEETAQMKVRLFFHIFIFGEERTN